MTTCSKCGQKISRDQTYLVKRKPMCEDCAMEAGLFPLGHNGSRRNAISEEGRVLTIPDWPPGSG